MSWPAEAEGVKSSRSPLNAPAAPPVLAARPSCAFCTWTYDSDSGGFRVKAVNRFCPGHGRLLT